MTEESASRKSGCLVSLRRILLGLVLIIAVLLIGGAIYQQQAMAQDLENYPPPGVVVDVNGFEMHLFCEGAGSPTAVMETGLTASSLVWWTVREDIAQQTRACVYDRAGLGWSEFTSAVPSSDYVVNNLHTLIENAGEETPFILVGHSAGGVYVREYARQFPDEVVGLILLDSSHENQGNRLPQEVVALNASPDLLLRICPAVSLFGIRRLLNLGDQFISDFYSDEQVRAQALTHYYRVKHCSAVINEMEGFAQDILQENSPASLGDLPLMVLTAGIGWADSAESSPDIPVEVLQEADRIWLEMQEELAALSSNSAHIILEESGHIIQSDQPDAIVDAVRDMLAMLE